MTTLSATSSSVAMNRTLSDLSFLAIVAHRRGARAAPNHYLKLQPTRPETKPGVRYTIAVSGQQSSVGLRPRHQLPRPGQPGFPAVSPPPREPTDDCSPLKDSTKICQG